MARLDRRTAGMLIIGASMLLILTLIFVKADVDTQQAFMCQAIDANPDLDMSQCPAHNSNISWFLMAAFGLAFIMLASGAYLMLMPAKTDSPKKADISALNEHEKRIHAILKQNDGSGYQSDLIKETGFSKVRMTRILDKMEGKGIIKRQRRGMTNIVILK